MQDGTIDRPDIITSKGFTTFEDLQKSIDAATSSLAKFIDTGKQAGVNIKGATSTKQLGEETKKLSLAQSELLKIEKQIELASTKNTQTYIGYQKVLAQVKQEQKERITLGQKDAKLLNEQNASVKQLEVALNKNRLAYKELANEEARNSKEGKELKAIIDQQDAAVKKLNGGLGDFTDNVGDYRGALKDLKTELKLAKDEMAFLAKTTGTTSPEFIAAAAKAGDLKDQIGDLNDQIKVTAGNKFEVLGNSLKDVGSKLVSLDFEGAANSAKQFAAVAKSLTFAEMVAGLQSVAATLKTVAVAILTNPLFIIAGVLAAVAFATKYFIDQQEKASQRAIENYKKEEEAMLSRYDKEIALQKILGKQTFELEKARQRVIIETANKQLDQLKGGKDRLNELLKAGLTLAEAQRFDAEVEKNLNEEKKKQIYDLVKAKRDAADQIEIIAAEQAEFERKTAADLAQQKKEDLFTLESFRLKVAIEAQEEIAYNEKNGFDNRVQAVTKFTKLKNQLARLEYNDAISQANLTAEAILLIEAELQKKLLDNRKVSIKANEEINNQLRKGIEDNMKKAGASISGNLKKPIDDTTGQIKKLEKEVGDMDQTFEHVTDNAGFKFRKLFEGISEQLAKAKGVFDVWANGIVDLFNNITASRIQKIDEESAANKATLDYETALYSDNAQRKAEVQLKFAAKEAELEKRRRSEARKAAILDKVLSLAGAIINTALAVTNQLAKGDPYTAFARSVAAGALGALQVTAIAARPIPSYQFGTKAGGHIGGLAQVGEVGTELMIKPGGGLELTPSVSTIMDIPRGTQVIPHDQTMRMLAMGALQRNGGSQQVTSHDPALLNELKQVNANLKNIKPAKQHSLVRSGATIYRAIQEQDGHTKLIRDIYLGKWF